jgi:hypothetical protein
MKLILLLLFLLVIQNTFQSLNKNNLDNLFPWFISIHAGEVQYSINITKKAFQIVKDLGIKGIRTDIFWSDIEPNKDQWDSNKLNFYKLYFETAKEFHLEPLIILSGAPKWAYHLYEFFNREEFWNRYAIYTKKVLEYFGNISTKYQLWNEVASMHDPILGEDLLKLFTVPGSIIKEYNKNYTTFINIEIFPMWDGTLTSWLLVAGKYIDVISIDYYPGTWSPVSWTDWSPLQLIIERINTINDPWYGKYGAIMETGFSSWNSILANEKDQKLWIEQSLPAARKLVLDNLNNQTQKFKIILSNYYQLIDAGGNSWELPEEHHFGILHQDLSPKLGFSSLKKEISLWS